MEIDRIYLLYYTLVQYKLEVTTVCPYMNSDANPVANALRNWCAGATQSKNRTAHIVAARKPAN